MTGRSHVIIRTLARGDSGRISQAFAAIGWNKPVEQYDEYLMEQEKGSRHVFVAETGKNFAGYVTVNWHSRYAPFTAEGIPEIMDLNVLPQFRRQGIGTRLMDKAEETVAERSPVVGIGVGMYPDYGNAQRLYVLRGYVPDGRGLTYGGKILKPMEQVVNDDDLVLYFVKHLR